MGTGRTMADNKHRFSLYIGPAPRGAVRPVRRAGVCYGGAVGPESAQLYAIMARPAGRGMCDSASGMGWVSGVPEWGIPIPQSPLLLYRLTVPYVAGSA